MLIFFNKKRVKLLFKILKFHNTFTGQNAIEDQFLKQCSKTSMKNIDIIDIMNIDIMLIEPNHPIFLATEL